MIIAKRISHRMLRKFAKRNLLENKHRNLVMVLTVMTITVLVLLIITAIANMAAGMKTLYYGVIGIVQISSSMILCNIMRTAVRFDFKLYERMRTIGSGSGQIKYVVFYQLIVTGIFGIIIGLILGCGITTLHRRSILFTAILMLTSVFTAGLIPAKIAGEVPAAETKKEGNGIKNDCSRLPYLFRLSLAGLGRNKTRSAVSIVFMALGLINLSCAYAVKELDINAIDKVRALISIIIFIISLLNFIHTMVAATTARRKEFGIMQSLGMTKKQLRIMLLFEGVNHAVTTMTLSHLLSLILILEIQWSVPYNLVINPLLVFMPVFFVVTLGIPFLCYLWIMKELPVKRLDN